jgi:hypothetical protein
MSDETPPEQSEKPRNKGGRPKGVKNRPKWMLDELKKVPKRPRGRPKGSQTKPKTLDELVSRAATYKPAPRQIKQGNKHKPKPGTTYLEKLKREDPEKLKEIRQKGIAAMKGARPSNLPPNMSRRQWAVTLDEAQKLAKSIMKNLDKKDALPENVIARQAMEQAVTMLASELPAKDKLAVIRTLLEYNMAKPAATQNLNVKTAEDFLDELAAKE